MHLFRPRLPPKHIYNPVLGRCLRRRRRRMCMTQPHHLRIKTHPHLKTPNLPRQIHNRRAAPRSKVQPLLYTQHLLTIVPITSIISPAMPPTSTPASSNFLTAQIPLPSAEFDAGQCDTFAPRAAISSRSDGDKCTACARMVRGVRRPKSSYTDV
ncbi:hypothetical protein CNMCM8060_000966 [Aspergillus lentulus]|nr:hypothetical protein CNMCM8060_000966 [Aspergillus lentulus]